MTYQYAGLLNRLLLGALGVVAGSLKLFVAGPDAVAQLLAGLGFPAAMFFAWLLILSELLFGLAILAGWKLEWTSLPQGVILFVAAFLVYLPIPNYQLFVVHLVLASNYFLLAAVARLGPKEVSFSAPAPSKGQASKAKKAPSRKKPAKKRK